jgi:hypothetical protein
VLLVTALLTVVVLGGLTIAAVQAGVVPSGWFDITLGNRRLVGYRTWSAHCPPFNGCEPTSHESYVVWLVPVNQRGDEPGVRLLHFPLE